MKLIRSTSELLSNSTSTVLSKLQDTQKTLETNLKCFADMKISMENVVNECKKNLIALECVLEGISACLRTQVNILNTVQGIQEKVDKLSLHTDGIDVQFRAPRVFNFNLMTVDSDDVTLVCEREKLLNWLSPLEPQSDTKISDQSTKGNR
jgi:hypothetical protein